MHYPLPPTLTGATSCTHSMTPSDFLTSMGLVTLTVSPSPSLYSSSPPPLVLRPAIVARLHPPPTTDSRVIGSDETLRARCLQFPREISAVRWVRVHEGQLFATVLHQSGQEISMVPVDDGVARCYDRGPSGWPAPSLPCLSP
jgi:hypothetical protein